MRIVVDLISTMFLALKHLISKAEGDSSGANDLRRERTLLLCFLTANANSDTVEAMAKSVGVGLEAFGDRGCAATKAKKSGGIGFAIFLALE